MNGLNGQPVFSAFTSMETWLEKKRDGPTPQPRGFPTLARFSLEHQTQIPTAASESTHLPSGGRKKHAARTEVGKALRVKNDVHLKGYGLCDRS